ncbi:hypothetical protein LJK87_06000 [Paenibacillus sp. P25]|nr:hypothetical protein LJK87_06000 [Paenibacillus sp. P25]
MSIYLYIFMFLSLWTIGLTVLARNFRNAYSRWMACAFFAGGCPSFAFSVHLLLIPFLKRHGVLTPALKEGLELISIPAIHLYWYFLSYFVLAGSIVFSGFLSQKASRTAAILLALPVILLLWFTADFNIPFEFRSSDVRLLFGLYMLASFAIYLTGCLKEKDPFIRKNRFRTSIFVITAMSWAYLNDFIGMDRFSFGPGPFEIVSNGQWKHNYLIIAWMVACFLFMESGTVFWGSSCGLKNKGLMIR